MYSRIKRKLLSYWCRVVGHWFVSNHVGVIRCERCKAPLEVVRRKL